MCRGKQVDSIKYTANTLSCPPYITLVFLEGYGKQIIKILKHWKFLYASLIKFYLLYFLAKSRGKCFEGFQNRILKPWKFFISFVIFFG